MKALKMTPEIYKIIKYLPVGKFTPTKYRQLELQINFEEHIVRYIHLLGHLNLFIYSKDKNRSTRSHIYLGLFSFDYINLKLGNKVPKITLDILEQEKHFFNEVDTMDATVN